MTRWTRAHDAQVKRILDLMQAEAKPFPDTSSGAVASRKALPFFEWCRTYLPHYFSAPESPLHRTAFDASLETSMPVFQCWSRGFGKSTIFTVAQTLRDILDRELIFGIVGARSEDVAAAHMHFVWLELQENLRLRADYGEAITRRDGDDNDFVVLDQRLWARGAGQSPRGQRYRQYRPRRFVGDDLEDDGIARNPTREDQLWDWLFGSVWPALEPGEARLLNLCTMYGRGCLALRGEEMASKLDETGRARAKYQIYPALDALGRSAWPERYPDSVLARSRSIVGERLFRREYLCKPDSDSASFRPDWMRAYDSSAIDRSRLRVVAYLDPSARSEERNDFKALIVLGWEAVLARVYCLHAWIRHASVGEMIAELNRISKAYGPGQIFCEANGFQSLIWEIHRRDVAMSPVTNTTNKLDRILSNQGEFERGACYFDQAEGDQRILVDQFLDLGRPGVHDDGPDAWDGARRRLPSTARGDEIFYRGARREAAYDALVSA